MRFKQFIAACLCICLVSAFVGCTGVKQTETENKSSTSLKINQMKETDVAETFIESLINNDYNSSGFLLGVTEENPFFTAKDVEWYVPRSSFANTEKFSDIKYKISDVTVSNSGDVATVQVSVVEKGNDDGISETFTVPLIRDNENKWFVNSPDFYVENWNFVTPGGDTQVVIDGKEIPSSTEIKIFGSAGLRREYSISRIGKSEKTITVTAENSFGSQEFKVNPTANSADEPYVCTVKLTDDKAYQAICDIWNNCYKDVCEGKQASDLVKYISENADTNITNIMYNGIKNDAINSGTSGCSNYICSNVRACSGEDYYSQYLTDKISSVYFNYDMNWYYNLAGWDQSMKNSTNLLLSFENGEYKIYNPGDKFFTWYNSFTNKTN